MKVILDLDDWSILRSRMDLLETIKDHYPNFKVSLFTIPFDYEYEMSQLRINKTEALERIHKNLDWMEFIPHGLAHMPREFEKADKITMETYIDNIEEEFKKLGLPMVKGFKAPYWLWNQEVVDVLNERGWWGAINRDDPNMICPKHFYKYDFSIDEPFWLQKKDLIRIHGHMTLPSRNNLEDCLLNIMKLPSDVEWCFASEFVEELK